MTVDIKNLERALAENKVYDAWQYVQSLLETLSYMHTSYDLLNTVHEHRVSTLQDLQKEKYEEAITSGRSFFEESDLHRTDLNIGGYILDDTIFLRKTTMEFFHYGRMSLDVVFQIVNAALLGDAAIDVEDKRLLSKLIQELKKKPEFATLVQIMDTNKSDSRFQYLTAFDNYMKHIKTILVTVKNSVFIGEENIFKINAFCYGGTVYGEVDTLDKVKEVYEFIIDAVDAILNELIAQVPNCISNNQRIQEISYKWVVDEQDGKPYIRYLSHFIDVPNGVADLPPEIKVSPLIIQSDGEVCSFDYKFDKIFIRKVGTDEDGIVGVATLKNGVATNEFYRTYVVQPCSQVDYLIYTANFKTTYSHHRITLNPSAMKGTMVFITDSDEDA